MDICQSLKDAGFVYREPSEEMKKHPKYLAILELYKDEKIIDKKDNDEIRL